MTDIIIAAVIAALLIGGALRLWIKVRRISREALGTDDPIEGFRQQEQRYRDTPRSVAAMTELELPRIRRDFPDFSWEDRRHESEETIVQMLSALSAGDAQLAPEKLRRAVQAALDEDAGSGRRVTYSDVRIHRSEISRYEKRPGLCRIVVQTAAEYRRTVQSVKAWECLTDAKEQHRFETELTFDGTWMITAIRQDG